MNVSGSTILITGGTGSFGNRVAAHLLKQSPAQIRIFSRDEKKQWEMQQAFPQFQYLVGDVREEARLEEAMAGVDLVFHAAALKHVPSCEKFPYEAYKTNVGGSQNACRTAKAAGVKTFVALSTDKAVKPLNAMGTSKAMMEKLVCSQNQSGGDTKFCCVRYGNVMGSRGSVIPLFKRQIEKNEPLTLTVPEMTRFLMTLDQSVGLVLHAMQHTLGGEIFVRKSPACTVGKLAEAVRRKFSPKGADHPVNVTGIRPGEKLHETLVNEYEMQRVTEEELFYAIHPEYRVPDHRAAQPLGTEYTSANTHQLDSAADIEPLLDKMGEVELYI
jgi:UDP-N-acetylglucosamine 4,6-dehydratase